MNIPNMLRLCLLLISVGGLCSTRAEPAPIPATNLEDLQSKTGEEVTVEGAVHNAFWVRNQVLMITFQEERGGFVAVAFARNRGALNEAFAGDVLKAVAGKTIQVTGTLVEYESRPQIVIERPEQLTILD
jgi:DNA/RNA endonuclease YhcR with UshA esterase domain